MNLLKKFTKPRKDHTSLLQKGIEGVHSLAAVHVSNRRNHHDLASPSSKGSGKHIVFPVTIVSGFGTIVIIRRTTLTTVTTVLIQLMSTQVTSTRTGAS